MELPLQTRQVTDLIVLAGGAVNTGRVSALSTSQQRGHLGRRRSAQRRRVPARRGRAQQPPRQLANLPFPFPDALQEFSVATGGLAAATGMHSSASVNAVTKSGTNSFHGNGFEFFRDSRFNATSPFAPTGPDGKQVKDGLSKNQFGGTLGGPMVPDKLFFFGGYERNRVRQTTPDELCVRAHGRDAGGRLHRVCVRRVQRRRTGNAAGAVREQPDRPGAVQSRRR